MTSQREVTRLVCLYASALMVGVLSGCAGEPSPRDPSWTLMEITDVSMAAGEWEGMVKRDQAALPGGSVRLMIRRNSTYLFAGQTVSKAAVGSGDLEIRNGRLIGNTDRRTVTFSLYDHKGKPIMHVESINYETGERYHGEFTKVQ